MVLKKDTAGVLLLLRIHYYNANKNDCFKLYFGVALHVSLPSNV